MLKPDPKTPGGAIAVCDVCGNSLGSTFVPCCICGPDSATVTSLEAFAVCPDCSPAHFEKHESEEAVHVH
jgi:hypothetical protein